MKVNLLMKVLLVILVMFSALAADSPQQSVIEAVRITEPVKVDGLLDESVWQGRGYSNFIQSDPTEGAPASEKTVVRVAYDDEAIYVSARLFDSEPGKIIGRLARRDNFVDSDWFIFSVDPYYDRRSGYRFAVNPAGTIVDWTIFNDEGRDSTWDGIWESRTKIDDKGWSVEMRIPFKQLRFKKRDHYIWGVDFQRMIERKNEITGIVYVPKKDSGYASHFARLEGITGIKPGRHIEITPYSIGKAAFGTKEAGNPFKTGKDFLSNGGMDMKIGLKSNLTLDLTVNPDFGQVEVDPAVINLGASENFYGEKRPFFIEGANIFSFGYGGSNRNIGANWGNPFFFYSRRIGRPPQGGVNASGYVNYPDWSTILGAAKLTGKVGKDWNVGFISALTQREYAEVDFEANRSNHEVEPFSYYGVLRAQKEFNEGRQGLGFITTSVLRDLKPGTLQDSLNKNAFSFGMDGWTFLDKKKVWVVNGWFGGTRVEGSREAITGLQQSYPHYYQRPDATHVELDTNATSLSGWAGRVAVNKQKGNFLFNVALGAISPGFDSRDMGFQWSADVINGHVMMGYRSYKPGKLFRRWSVNVFTQRNYNFGGDKIGEQRLIFISDAQFRNYWNVNFQFSHNPSIWSHDFTRGGPVVRRPGNNWGEFYIGTDTRKSVAFSTYQGFNFGATGSWGWTFNIGMRWKPSSNFSLSISPEYRYNKNNEQWVNGIDDTNMIETYGRRYIFGNIDQKTVSCSIRLNWIFSPRLSLQAYIQPFIAVGAYDNFKELARPRSFDFNRFGEGGSTIEYSDSEGVYTVDPDGNGSGDGFQFGNPDFNFKSLRGTLVLRWEYRPGSTVYAVWTQNRADYSNPGDFRFGRDFNDLLRAPGDDIFMVKFTYRFKM